MILKHSCRQWRDSGYGWSWGQHSSPGMTEAMLQNLWTCQWFGHGDRVGIATDKARLAGLGPPGPVVSSLNYLRGEVEYKRHLQEKGAKLDQVSYCYHGSDLDKNQEVGKGASSHICQRMLWKRFIDDSENFHEKSSNLLDYYIILP